MVFSRHNSNKNDGYEHRILDSNISVLKIIICSLHNIITRT